MDMQTVLVVDDDKDIVRLIERSLVGEGFRVLSAYDGLEAVRLLDQHRLSLVILDVMMPQLDGIEVCRRIRERSNLPVIFLSARASDIDKVVGLSTGADDYMIKPFSIIELIARVKSQIRRYTYLNYPPPVSCDNTLRIQGIEIHESSRKASLYGKELNLTRTEFDILFLLVKYSDHVFSLDEIYKNVWQEKYFEGNNTVMVHIARLREKLGEGSREKKIIKNVWGVGYKIEKDNT